MSERTYRPPTDYPRGWRPRYLETGTLHVSCAWATPKPQPIHDARLLDGCARHTYADVPVRPAVPAAVTPAPVAAAPRKARAPKHYAVAEARRARIVAALDGGGVPLTLAELAVQFPGKFLRHDLEKLKRLGAVEVRVCTREGKPGHVAQYWPTRRAWPPLPAGWKLCERWGKQWQGP